MSCRDSPLPLKLLPLGLVNFAFKVNNMVKVVEINPF